jgi:LacI family transcriptional regulator
LIEWGEDFTAVLASSDGIALGALDVLRSHGFDVPTDVSLVGYGGARLGLHLKPTLTTVEIPFREMGRTGAELLLASIVGEGDVRTEVFQPSLRVGNSAQSPSLRNRLPPDLAGG